MTPKPDKQELLSHAVVFCKLDIANPDWDRLSLSEMGIDSLELMSLSMELEASFGLRLGFGEIHSTMTLPQLLDHLIEVKQ